jgi:hypothetical protein
MAKANKYQVGQTNGFEWYTGQQIINLLNTSPKLFNVPSGNTLAVFGDELYLHITQAKDGVLLARYAIYDAQEDAFGTCPYSIEGSFNNTFTLNGDEKLTKKQAMSELAELFNYTANALILINAALDLGFIKYNGNIRHLLHKR